MLGLVLIGVGCSQILFKSFGIVCFILWKRIKSRPSWAVCFLKNNNKNQLHISMQRSEMCRVFLSRDLKKSCSTILFFNSLSILCLLFFPPSFMATLCTPIFFSCIPTLSSLGCFLLSCLSLFFTAEHSASTTLMTRWCNHLQYFHLFLWFSSVCGNLFRALVLWDLSYI